MVDNMTEQELKDKAISIAFRTFTSGTTDLVNSEEDFEKIYHAILKLKQNKKNDLSGI